ncbi:50S ribosomal protein L23 [Candidatus Daviesbacteria bacterium]|nr:50S ribosomal protein L23 [Candidatus Daviesbacteria bacterium]
MFIILKKPLVTEKSMTLAQKGLYTFEVNKKATKDQIAKEVAKRFSVNILSVKTINTKGALKSQKRVRRLYKLPDTKKAIVQVQKGQKIAIFETPKASEEAVVTKVEEEPVIMKEKKDLLGKTKVKVEKNIGAERLTTQRKVITGK